jgi:hypothetical protein
MLNPSISLAVAAERMADMRREAERYRAGREAAAWLRATRQRRVTRRIVIHETTATPADEAGSAMPAEISQAQELCLTGSRQD